MERRASYLSHFRGAWADDMSATNLLEIDLAGIIVRDGVFV